jgi:hypothetical protein
VTSWGFSPYVDIFKQKIQTEYSRLDRSRNKSVILGSNIFYILSNLSGCFNRQIRYKMALANANKIQAGLAKG